MKKTELSKNKYTLINGNKFKLLFNNEKFKIVEVKIKRRDGSGKWNSFYYADFGYTTTVDFYSKSSLKKFIKDKGFEKEFSKSFMRTA